jgi:alpha-beta hydrolase superfamily lysophospholipase
VPHLEIRTATARKQPLYFGAAGRTLLGFYHPPAAGAARRDTAVVLCAPIGTDHQRSDLTYRHLAERLAAMGFPCLRFDLSATGDSGGEDLTAGFVRSWIDDVGLAVDELRTRSGARAISLVGLRLGATLVSVAASERGDIDSVVLWSPCVSGAGYVTEVTRLHTLYTRIEPHVGNAPRPSADGAEALGMFLPRALMGELGTLDLMQATRPPARQALVIDGGNLPGRDALLGRLRELGAETELRSHPGHKFLVTVSHRQVVPDEILASITGWLDRVHPETVPARPDEARPGSAGPAGERPLVFGARHPLFGILTPAHPGAMRDGRPSIIVANAGCVNRQGPHAMFVRMARRWAALGFDVLRVDLSGIGDSPVAPGAKENVTYPESGTSDLEEAISATGHERAIVVGLCSGGDYAFQLGSTSASVAGAWILNPRTFGVLDLASVESGVPPTTPVADVPGALRSMAERGIDTTLVVSRGDPGVAYVDAHAGEAMRALSGVEGFARFDVEGADHPFTPVMVQKQVSDLLTERLAGRFAGVPHAAGSEARIKAFRFSEDELALLQVIQGHTGIRSRTEALRTVLEYYAKAEGLEVGKETATATDKPVK